MNANERAEFVVAVLLCALACNPGEGDPAGPSADVDVCEQHDWTYNADWTTDLPYWTPDESSACNGATACNGWCVEEVDPDDTDVTPAKVDCAAWHCGSADYPAACFHNPTAQLWIPGEQLKLMLENPKRDIEVDGVLLLHGKCMAVGVEIHGGLAQSFEKKAFRVKFNRTGWFPLDPFSAKPGEKPPADPIGYKQLIFKAHWVDPSLLRDRLAHDLLRRLGGLAPRVTFINLVLNGRYNGVYALTESITEDFFLRLGRKGTGNLYKAINHQADFKNKPNALAGYEKKTNVNGPDDDLVDLLEAIADTPADYEAFGAAVGPLIDLDLYFRYLAINVFSHNQDAFTKNYYLYCEPETAGIGFQIVNWDADGTFGRSWDGNAMPVQEGTVWGKKNHLSLKLSGIPEYSSWYGEYLEAELESTLAYESTSELLHDIAAELENDTRFEECRWKKDGAFAADVDMIDAFLAERPEYLDGLL